MNPCGFPLQNKHAKSYWLIAEAEIKTSSKKRGVVACYEEGWDARETREALLLIQTTIKKRYLDYLLVEMMEKTQNKRNLPNNEKKKHVLVKVSLRSLNFVRLITID